MSYQNSSQSYMRTVAKPGVRQQVRSKRALSIPGGVLLLRAVGKAVLIILPLTLIVNIIISSAISNIDRSISQVEGRQQKVEDTNIHLLARKARIWAPDHVEKLAGDKLSLFVPTKDQVGKFDRRSGTFSYL